MANTHTHREKKSPKETGLSRAMARIGSEHGDSGVSNINAKSTLH